MTGFGIPDAIGRPGLATGTRWRPAQCLIRGAVGRQDARAGEKAPWMRNAVLTRLPWPDSIFLMPLVAQLAAGFGSLAVRSIRNAAKWTRMPGVPPWRRTLAAPRLPWPQFRVPVGSGAPGRKHDYSRGAPGLRPSAVGVSHAPAGKRPSGRGHLVSDYAAIT